jgi:hypothetical protein
VHDQGMLVIDLHFVYHGEATYEVPA